MEENTVLLRATSSNPSSSTINHHHLQPVNHVFTLAMARQHFPMTSPGQPPQFTIQACPIPIPNSSRGTSSRPLSAEPTVDLLVEPIQELPAEMWAADQVRHKSNNGGPLFDKLLSVQY